MQHQDIKAPRPNRLIRILIPVLIIACGVGVAAYFKISRPTPQKAEIRQARPQVETITATRVAEPTRFSGMGTVVPAHEIELKAQVSGSILSVSSAFETGGRFRQGREILRINPKDYQLTLQRAESALCEAKAAYDLEMGNQEVARQEFEYMKRTAPGATKDAALALREPQRLQVEAKIVKGQADVEQARVDLVRTVIRAPFNALVTETTVDRGSMAVAQQKLATLVCTDRYNIEVSIPLDKLKYIDFKHPKRTSVHIVSPASGGEWTGRIVRMAGTLSEKTRMAKVIVAVDDPLGLRKKNAALPLLLDDYVHVDFTGKVIDNVIVLPRTALRGDSSVWVANGESLEIRHVDVVWKEDEQIFVANGLQSGDNIIVSNLAAPVEGMPVAAVKARAFAQGSSTAETTEVLN